jgi:hypothetical protein
MFNQEINNIKNPKSVINDSINNKNDNTIYKKVLSIILFILSIIYVIIKVDFDTTLIGMLDDFFIFMSSFCYMYSQFLNMKIRAALLLKMVSLVFCFLGVATLLVLLLVK